MASPAPRRTQSLSNPLFPEFPNAELDSRFTRVRQSPASNPIHPWPATSQKTLVE